LEPYASFRWTCCARRHVAETRALRALVGCDADVADVEMRKTITGN
jgi:hypothetical protein